MELPVDFPAPPVAFIGGFCSWVTDEEEDEPLELRVLLAGTELLEEGPEVLMIVLVVALVVVVAPAVVAAAVVPLLLMPLPLLPFSPDFFMLTCFAEDAEFNEFRDYWEWGEVFFFSFFLYFLLSFFSFFFLALFVFETSFVIGRVAKRRINPQKIMGENSARAEIGWTRTEQS